MALINRKAAALAAVMTFALEAPTPALAQTTMLMGTATHTNVVTPVPTSTYYSQLTRMEPRYDTRVVPVQRVRVAPPRTVYRTVYVRDNRTYFQRHPKVKATVVGAGVGTAAGALTGLVTGRGVLRGAAIGAGSGAGIGLVRSSNTMKRHPIVRDVATGAIAGLGLGWAGSRRRGMIAKTTGVGAAVGLGWGLFRHLR